VPSDEAEVFQNKQKIGWLVFSPVDIEETDIPDEPIDLTARKHFPKD